MDTFVRLLVENKEWLFSGLGIAVISGIICFFRRKPSPSIKQVQKSGAHSFNVQAGRNAFVSSQKVKDDK